MRLKTEIAEKFVVATGALLTACWSEPDPGRRLTVTFTYAPTGWLNESDLAEASAEHDVDVVHLEFDQDREFAGPSNLALSEESDGAIHTWPRCRLWADQASRVVLVIPDRQDFGFGYDGAAIVRVTDLKKGTEMDEGIRRARDLLLAAALRVPSNEPFDQFAFTRRPRGARVN